MKVNSPNGSFIAQKSRTIEISKIAKNNLIQRGRTRCWVVGRNILKQTSNKNSFVSVLDLYLKALSTGLGTRSSIFERFACEKERIAPVALLS